MKSYQRGALVLLVLLALFGMGVGGLMSWHHDTQLYATDAQKGALIGCAEAEGVNCDIVNTSAWSEVLGVPLGTWAIPFYGMIAVVAGLGLSGQAGAGTLISVAGLGSVAFSAFLYFISVTELGNVCAWCMRLYMVNAATLVLGLVSSGGEKPASKLIGTTLGAWFGIAVLAIGGQQLFKASLLGEGGPEANLDAKVEKLKGDPKGPAPTMSFTVTTEEKNTVTFTLDPDDAWKGNPKSKVAVVEFADLECGFCKRTSSEIARLYAAYGDRVLFVFKHFPMNPSCNPGVKNPKHRDACNAALAAVCAQEQGAFWAFHDLAFKNQHQLGADYLRTYAKEAGANIDTFNTCYADKSKMDVVRRDGEAGKSLDIRGTPRIFINGKLYRSGSSAESMAKEIEIALGATAEEAASKASSLKEQSDAVAPIPADVAEMQTVTLGDLKVKIDTFEAAIVDGKAVSGKHNIPAIRSSWMTAKAACEAAGKRLCTEQEWVSVCQNAKAADDNQNGQYADDMIEGTAYPYADFHDKSRCWDGKEGAQFRPVYTGEMPGCNTPSGVYDLTGNLEEWVGDSPETAALLGGAWDTKEDHARCYRRNDTFGAGYANARTGFRCCANP
ncbi:MAG: thioredoxin domain-containing protein [Deltaproteobacteria bacterium]|nr:thioredoxin domain-containing protein [Deltaproteobacteria bacterium]